PTEPNWPYGVSKLAAEKYCKIYQDVYKIPIVSLRYGIVYGEREWLGRVLTMFIRRVILKNKPPVVFGGGGQLRDFIYVGDVVRLHTLCIEGNESGVFNVSTGKGTSIKNLAKLVIGLSGKRFPIIFEDLPEGKKSKFMPERKRIPQELEKMVLSPKKAFKVFNWKSCVSLKGGIMREINWICNNPKAWETIKKELITI
ncbi:MAG: NAD-dependent epimerase/dehydratase family protein, partial [Candidatus Omnitrophica bacterium]|nr:NAD-dependent epimerase/dehydratase family protein [Candidatus Omnitrophota bacterium]